MVVAFVAVFLLSSSLEGNRPPLPADYPDSDLAVQAKKLRGYAVGAEGLFADWYWILSLQYLGNKILDSKQGDVNIDNLSRLNPRLLFPYLDNATSLDPKFTAAYSFGAVVLPAIDVSKAIELTEKGIQNNPEHWRLYQYLGYIYWTQKDYASAAKVYDEGSRIEGAPPFMRQMVAAMNAAGGSRETARSIYTQMLNESEDEQSKANAQIRLFELDSMDEREAVNAQLKELKRQTGRCPTRLGDIFPALRRVTLPGSNDFDVNTAGELVDPTGVAYAFDRDSCEIGLADESKIPRSAL